MADLITGDDTVALVTLEDDAGEPVPIVGATDVRAVIADADRLGRLIDPIVCSGTHPEADWANGVVAVPVPGTATRHLDPQPAHWQVRVVLGGSPVTYRTALPFQIAKGLIP